MSAEGKGSVNRVKLKSKGTDEFCCIIVVWDMAMMVIDRTKTVPIMLILCQRTQLVVQLPLNGQIAQKSMRQIS